ncbi:(Fe-S)-binding protein [Stenotrophobium rhamnosiphilum]|uniref:Glycolate oxidase iron-sulfur subunit n=1 Tax=Stenotrophobium rhamnosiphilum TaxID=2029166 RepID=A0A2T5MDM3_9GAMM|nr:(Fe-S)-binding protein [Stenotrophobium rhamnosiphilum]PTU30659.1 (Fe-S)-binding protein [Stenotrophobium rhamnosiphilum]
MSSLSSIAIASEFPYADADLCVKCGLCLPHCPTYEQTQNEADSPRGRIALMQGLANGLIQPSNGLNAHLDGCLSCRACETVCPAKVPYGRLIDSGRALLHQKSPRQNTAIRLISFWLTKASARKFAATFLWLYQRSGMQSVLRHTHLLGRGRIARLDSLLPRISLPRPLQNNARKALTSVSLFTGCTGELADRQTLQDALHVLSKLGISVDIPARQGCCGALHQHTGYPAEAAKLAQNNVQAFGSNTTILSSASGCGATLMEYPEILGASGAAFSQRVQDLSTFLLSKWPNDLALKPLKMRVAIHTPCTLKNVMKGGDAVRALLEKIPGVEIVALDSKDRCCGAAGSYFITQPEMADQLLAEKLVMTRVLVPDIIISSNIGCSMHLAAGLRREGIKAELLHPVSLLARQLG